MKRIFLICFTLFIGITVFATDKDIVIIRVEYVSKKDTEVESKLYCDIGVANTHIFYGALTNQENTVQIKGENDKIQVFTKEVDLINYLYTLGFTLKSTYNSETYNRKFVNFILIKE